MIRYGETKKSAGRPKKGDRVTATLRIDRLAYQTWRTTGPGFQERMAQILEREAAKLGAKRQNVELIGFGE